MPLSRAPGAIIPEVEVIKFPMQDPVGQRVTASITYEALEDVLTGGNPSPDALVQRLLSSRAYYEGIESKLYDRGQSSPRVTSADVKI